MFVMKKRVLLGICVLTLALASCKAKNNSSDTTTDDEDTSEVSDDTTDTGVSTQTSVITLTSNLSEGVTLTGAGEYEEYKTVTVSADAYLGYKFKGWKKDGEIVSEDETYIFSVPVDDIALEAYYLIDDDIKNLVYTSDYDTCVVSGVVDKSVSDLVVPEYVTKIEEGALSGCGNLKSLTLPFIGGENKGPLDGDKPPLGYVFGETEYEGSTRVVQLNPYAYAYTNSDGEISYTSGLNAQYYSYIPSGLTKVSLVGAKCVTAYAFSRMTLDTVEISNSLIYTDNFAFYDCTISNIYYQGDAADICNIDSSRGSLFGSADYDSLYFYIDGSYTNFPNEIVIPEGVTEIKPGAFKNCTSTESITIPKSIKKIGEDAFRYVPAANVYYNGSLDDWCSIEIGEAGNGLATTYDQGVAYIKTLYVLDDNGDVSYNGKTYKAVTGNITLNKIGQGSFCDYDNISEVVLEEGITVIPDFAFFRSSITSIYIPSTVTEIEYFALGGSDLKTIYNASQIDLSSAEAREEYDIADDVEVIVV